LHINKTISSIEQGNAKEETIGTKIMKKFYADFHLLAHESGMLMPRGKATAMLFHVSSWNSIAVAFGIVFINSSPAFESRS